MGKSKISPTSDEWVLDQLSVCEEKLLKVLEDLDQRSGKDLEVISKEMNEEEVCTCEYMYKFNTTKHTRESGNFSSICTLYGLFMCNVSLARFRVIFCIVFWVYLVVE